jgi:Xaa-Pro aminopeptidase
MTADARGFHTEDRNEVDLKAETVAAIARAEALDGILVSTQHNFAWLSGGRHNRVDGSRETGVAHLLIAADGRRFLLANNIEAQRMSSEVLDGLGFEVIEFGWAEERCDPALLPRTAVKALKGASLGTDTGGGGSRMVEPLLVRARSRLSAAEIARYRALGRDASRVVGDVARRVPPRRQELDVARDLAAALIEADMRPIVVLAGADERIAAYRHPVPTRRRWERTLLLVACAERHGLIAAVSRIVSSADDPDLDARTRACAEVFGRIAAATLAGASGSSIFKVAQKAYSDVGHPGEEGYHHQGGAIGYRSREWVAHPASSDAVAAPQAFAWNPSIAGTKVEETFLLHEDGRIELLTHDPAWPAADVEVGGVCLRLPLVLARHDA